MEFVPQSLTVSLCFRYHRTKSLLGAAKDTPWSCSGMCAKSLCPLEDIENFGGASVQSLCKKKFNTAVKTHLGIDLEEESRSVPVSGVGTMSLVGNKW